MSLAFLLLIDIVAKYARQLVIDYLFQASLIFVTKAEAYRCSTVWVSSWSLYYETVHINNVWKMYRLYSELVCLCYCELL
jgi:hypothetical protein